MVAMMECKCQTQCHSHGVTNVDGTHGSNPCMHGSCRGTGEGATSTSAAGPELKLLNKYSLEQC